MPDREHEPVNATTSGESAEIANTGVVDSEYELHASVDQAQESADDAGAGDRPDNT